MTPTLRHRATSCADPSVGKPTLRPIWVEHSGMDFYLALAAISLITVAANLLANRLPVPLHQPHRITAHITAQDGRALHVAATGTGDDGVLRFTATARFIAVSVEHFAAHGDLGEFAQMLELFARDGNHRTMTVQPEDDTQC